MTKYNLLSVPMVHTPGLVRAAIETYKTDKAYWDRVFTEWYNLPLAACEALFSGEVEYELTDNGETVTFEHTVVEEYADGRDFSGKYEP